MAINFPNNPINGDTHVVDNITYTYDSAKGKWDISDQSVVYGNLADIRQSIIPRLDGQYDLGSSGRRWKDLYLSGTSIDLGGLILTNNNGTLNVDGAAVGSGGGGSSTPAINGDGTVNEPPMVLTEPPTTHILNFNGTTSTVTMLAEDPDGGSITYGIAYRNSGNTRPAQLAADTTVDANGVYTFTPTTTQANAGNFTARLSATDGVSVTTRTVDFSLSFQADIEYMMVAGGGGGGEEFGGGGGAGGVIISTAALPLDGTTYNIVIGQGGAGGSSDTQGGNGGNTTFLGKTALGGGGGGYYAAGTAGSDGGSGGGGGSSESSTTHAGGAATQPSSTDGGFGYAGGYGYGRNGYLGGGGGGAGGLGGNAIANTSSGDGGLGIEWPVGSGNKYAGGGSGGAYTYSNSTAVGSVDTATGAGLGSGLNAGTGVSATANTGSGGGGGGYPGGIGGDGGSGIVIIYSNAQFASTTGTEVYDSNTSKWIYTFTADGNFVVP